MAKQFTSKSGAPARIRLVVLDAELPDGDIGSLTQALQNALRPSVAPAGARIAAPNGTRTLVQQPPLDEEQQAEEQADTEDVLDDVPVARGPRVKRSTPRAPNVVDLDMNTPISLATFAQGKDSKSQSKKFMIAAAWLKEHRSIDAVTADHIYTCFKSLGWSTSIPDFGMPLRDLKAKQKFFSKTERGYEINHLGLDFAKKLGGSDGAS